MNFVIISHHVYLDTVEQEQINGILFRNELEIRKLF